MYPDFLYYQRSNSTLYFSLGRRDRNSQNPVGRKGGPPVEARVINIAMATRYLNEWLDKRSALPGK